MVVFETNAKTRAAALFSFVMIAGVIFGAAAQAAGGSEPAAYATAAAELPAVRVITRDEAARLALTAASTFQQSQFDARIAGEDVRQARVSLFPLLNQTAAFAFNTPGGNEPGLPRAPSFIAPNSIREHTNTIGLSGTLDISGNLHAILRHDEALLAAARDGSEVSRKALILSVDQSYFNLALAAAKRQSAEKSLASVEELERVAESLCGDGKADKTDVMRARVETTTMRDELEQARSDETGAAFILKSIIGLDAGAGIAATDLTAELHEAAPLPATDSIIIRLPELRQNESLLKSAEYDFRAVRTESKPQLAYSFGAGFDSDSFNAVSLDAHFGYIANLGVVFPLFDWGWSRSRKTQAISRLQSLRMQRALLMRDARIQYDTALAQADSARKRAGILQSGMDDALKNLDANAADFRAGKCSVIEVFDAQNSLASQRESLYQAIYNYEIAMSVIKNIQEFANVPEK